MSFKFLVFLAGLGASGLLAQSASEEKTFEVSGQVITLDTGQPLDRIQVSLADIITEKRQWRVETKADGQFRFLVPEGKYRLSGERNGIPRQVFGQGTAGFGSAVLAGRGSTANLRFAMFLPATLRGAVVDEAGEPAEGVLIQLVKDTVFDGKARMIPAAQTQTDDRGEYRFAGLTPGKYYVAASGRPWFSGYVGVNDQLNLAAECFGTVFYPNAALSSAATAIPLPAGAELVANLRVTAIGGAVLRAAWDNSDDANSVEQGQIVLRARTEASSPWVQYTGALTPSSIVVPYGEYMFEARGIRGGIPVYQSVRVSANSPDVAVALDLKPAPIITGRIEEGAEDLAHLGPFLVLVNLEETRATAGSLQSNGEFTFLATPPGTYRLVLQHAPGFYIDRLQVDGVEQRDLVVTVEGNHVPKLKLHLSRNAGKIHGITRKRDEPVPGVLVVLAARTGAASVFRPIAFQTDSDGSFQFDSVPPGNYILLTSYDYSLEYANPAVIRELESSGTPVVISGGGMLEINLQASSR